MPTVPNPRLWSDGDKPTPEQFNSDIRDPINWFASPPLVEVRADYGTTNIPWATWTALAFNIDVNDRDDSHGGSSTHLTVKTNGYYQCFAQVRWEDHLDNTGARGVLIRKNGSLRVCGDFRRACNWSLTPNNRHGQSCTGFIGLSGTEYIECLVWHDQTNGYTDFTPPFYHPSHVDSHIYHADPNGALSVRFGMIWLRY